MWLSFFVMWSRAAGVSESGRPILPEQVIVIGVIVILLLLVIYSGFIFEYNIYYFLVLLEAIRVSSYSSFGIGIEVK